eukprot:jgi/Botrbrau1/14155/Bobra.182_3s0095.1
MAGKILTISTSADLLNGLKTGLWLEELAAPYYVWKESGFDVVIGAVSDKIPLDVASLAENMKGPLTNKFLEDAQAQQHFNNPVSIASIGSIDDFAAIYVPGGHGIVEDGPASKKLADLLQQFYEAGKVVSSVCHGPASFTGAVKANGEPLVKGKKVTGFSNSEEMAVKKEQYMPWQLEDKLKELGADYSKGEDWSSYTVTDGNIVTGQNPQSSEAVAEAVLAVLRK